VNEMKMKIKQQKKWELEELAKTLAKAEDLMPVEYCYFCGSEKVWEWNGHYSTKTGKKTMRPVCRGVGCYVDCKHVYKRWFIFEGACVKCGSYSD
jgi:hypothetical protein